MKQRIFILSCLGLLLFIILCMNKKTIENFTLSGTIFAETCKDDPHWKNGNKDCKSYSVKGQDCIDLGDNGKTAFESCLVACDNCIGSHNIETPSIEEYEEIHDEHTDYSHLGDNDRTDVRYIYNQLDELNDKIDKITN